ncbi:MAG: 2-oxoacid:acceptor oxidoreductase family protein [Spirochaetaceae bacterium]
MILSIHTTGLGGQGVLTFSKLIADYAHTRGLKVTLFHAKGMAQRGGRVTSDIRISTEQEIEFDPRISKGGADILVGLEIGEALNSLPYIKEEGLALLHTYAAVPSSVLLDKKSTYPEAGEVSDIYRKVGASVYTVEEIPEGANIFFLGVLTAVSNSREEVITFDMPAMEEIISRKLKYKTKENLKNYKKGYTYGRELPQ